MVVCTFSKELLRIVPIVFLEESHKLSQGIRIARAAKVNHRIKDAPTHRPNLFLKALVYQSPIGTILALEHPCSLSRIRPILKLDGILLCRVTLVVNVKDCIKVILPPSPLTTVLKTCKLVRVRVLCMVIRCTYNRKEGMAKQGIVQVPRGIACQHISSKPASTHFTQVFILLCKRKVFNGAYA